MGRVDFMDAFYWVLWPKMHVTVALNLWGNVVMHIIF